MSLLVPETSKTRQSPEGWDPNRRPATDAGDMGSSLRVPRVPAGNLPLPHAPARLKTCLESRQAPGKHPCLREQPPSRLPGMLPTRGAPGFPAHPRPPRMSTSGRLGPSSGAAAITIQVLLGPRRKQTDAAMRGHQPCGDGEGSTVTRVL